MIQMMYVLMAAGGVMLAGVGANEMTHGGMAEAMRLGHHHMADHGGYHCASPDSMDWQRHVDHMHIGTQEHCGDGHMRHQGHAGMMP